MLHTYYRKTPHGCARVVKGDILTSQLDSNTTKQLIKRLEADRSFVRSFVRACVRACVRVI